MKTLTTIIAAISLLLTGAFLPSQAQDLKYNAPVKYASYVNQSVTGSSEPYSTVLGVSMVNERRTYDIGVILNQNDFLTGAEFMHKVFLNKKQGTKYNVNHFNTRPYIVYNFVYHYSQSQMQLADGKIMESGAPVNVTELEAPTKVITMEHYLGVGFEQDIIKKFYVSTNVGLGLYLGRNNNNNKVDPTVEQRQENGFSWSLKFGFGYRF